MFKTAHDLALLAFSDFVFPKPVLPTKSSDCAPDSEPEGKVCDRLPCESCCNECATNVESRAATKSDDEGGEEEAAHGGLSGGLGFGFEAGEHGALYHPQVHQPRLRNRALLARGRVDPEPLRNGLRLDPAKLGDLNGAPKRFDDVG